MTLIGLLDGLYSEMDLYSGLFLYACEAMLDYLNVRMFFRLLGDSLS